MRGIVLDAVATAGLARHRAFCLTSGVTLRSARGGAAAGLLLWVACRFLLPAAPGAPAFLLTAAVFVFGSGALPLLPVEHATGRAERVALACALGVTTAPLVLYVLALARCPFLFPPLAFVGAGVMAARWAAPSRHGPETTRADQVAYAALAVLAMAVVAWASAGRLVMSGDRLAIFGNYDTLDLTYYAAIAGALDHTRTIPPLSPFYAGHRVVHSYFPMLLLAAIRRFSGASMLESFLWFGWPFFGAVTAAAFFAYCRRLGSTPFAVVSTVLLFTGSTLAYLAAWLRPEMVQNDPLVWSSMFLAPSAEWLAFNGWTPALGTLAVGLYALTRIDEPEYRVWLVLASACFGLLFMVKSFAIIAVLPAVGIAGLVGWLRRDPRGPRLMAVSIGAGLWAAPWLLVVMPYNRVENRGAQIAVEWLSLVHRMLQKTGGFADVTRVASWLTGPDPGAPAILAVASAIFLLGGLGLRVLGAGGLVRAAVGAPAMRDWTTPAWMCLVGIAIPFAISVQPFPNTIQTYMLGLFLSWPFAARVVWPANARPTRARWIATIALVGLSVPATAHYVRASHAATGDAPLKDLGPGDMRVIGYLQRQTDADHTMLLHSDTLMPSIYGLEAERRVVLAWSSYVTGDSNPEVDGLGARIAAFFGTPGEPGADDLALLRDEGVTHVIERVATDQLHPHVREALALVTGTPDVRLYAVPDALRR
jgi:hypothetical protein